MIIKMTVNDNDFGNELESFARKLSSRITRLPRNIEQMEAKEQLECIRSLRKIDRLMNPNVTENHTEEEKELLIRKTKEAFSTYVKEVCKDESDADYLIRNFKVEIIETMTDKWENGEMFYWFQHSGVVINQ